MRGPYASIRHIAEGGLTPARSPAFPVPDGPCSVRCPGAAIGGSGARPDHKSLGSWRRPTRYRRCRSLPFVLSRPTVPDEVTTDLRSLNSRPAAGHLPPVYPSPCRYTPGSAHRSVTVGSRCQARRIPHGPARW